MKKLIIISKIIYNRLKLKLLLGSKVHIKTLITEKNLILDFDKTSCQNLTINVVNFRQNCCIRIRNKGSVMIGYDVFFNSFCSINCLDSITIGDYCIFGENVKLYDHNHRFNQANIPFKKQGFSTGAIIIGNNCWIGSNVTILKNVTIGDNVVVGAGCTIDQNIPSNSIVKSDTNIIVENIKWKENQL